MLFLQSMRPLTLMTTNHNQRSSEKKHKCKMLNILQKLKLNIVVKIQFFCKNLFCLRLLFRFFYLDDEMFLLYSKFFGSQGPHKECVLDKTHKKQSQPKEKPLSLNDRNRAIRFLLQVFFFLYFAGIWINWLSWKPNI